MAYSKVGWKDYPDTSTPITADRLNHMDDQIKNNTDDLETVKPEVVDLKDKSVDLQDQINEKLVSIDNGEWINNMLAPATSEKRIGTYNGNKHYEKTFRADITTSGVNTVTFDVTDILGYNVSSQEKGRITSINGAVTDADGNTYPVGYCHNGAEVMCMISKNAASYILNCYMSGLSGSPDTNHPRCVLVTVTYYKYVP